MTCAIKFATIAQSGWRLSLEVQSIGHNLPITISAFLTFLFIHTWVPVHQIELVRSSVSLQAAMTDNSGASASETTFDFFVISSTSAVSSLLLFCGMFLPFLAPSAKIHSTATIFYYISSMVLNAHRFFLSCFLFCFMDYMYAVYLFHHNDLRTCVMAPAYRQH